MRSLRMVVFTCVLALCIAVCGTHRADAAPCTFTLAQNPEFASTLSPWQSNSGWFWFQGDSQGEARDENDSANGDTLNQMIYGVVPGTVITVQPRWAYNSIYHPGDSDGQRLDLSYAGVVYASFSTALHGDTSGIGTMTAMNGATISPSTPPNITKTVVYSVTLPAGVPEQGLLQLSMTTLQHVAGSGSEWIVLDFDATPSSICLQETTQGGTQGYNFTTTNLDTNTATTAVNSTASITTTTAGTAATFDANATEPGDQALLDLTLGSAATIAQTAVTNWVLLSAGCTDSNDNSVSGDSLSGTTLTVPGSLTGTTSLLICTFVNTPNVPVSESFTPASIVSPATSTLTITIADSTAGAAAMSGMALSDTLPGGVVVAPVPAASTTCGAGTVSATAGATQIALSKGSVAAGASCTVSVNVTSSTAGSYTNTIPAGALTTNAGATNSASAGATLNVTVLEPTVAVSKTDNGPWTIGQSGAQYTITPKNTGGAATNGTITVTDTLPAALTATGTPTGSGWSCSVSGGDSITCTTASVIAAGANGNVITLPVSVGNGTPTGADAIANTAYVFGGGDPVHTSAGTAAASAADQTTIYATPSLNNAAANGNVAIGTTATDTFTLTNTSGQPGKFNVPASPTITGSGGAISPSGYVVNGGGTVYGSLAALQAALAALPATASGASITVGVQYTVPASEAPTQTVTDQLSATVAASGVTSPAVAATATDTVVGATLALSKTDNGPWTIGQSGANYTITPRNTGNAATAGTITVTDTVPGNLAISATPTGTGWACSVTGGNAMTCTSSTVIAAGANATVITVPVTIGAGTATGPDAISNVAQAYGGGDAAHSSGATAVSSPADQTTVNGPAELTNAASNENLTPGTTQTDTFTLTNTSGQTGTFNIPAIPTITAAGSTITPSGYVVNGGATVYTTLSALQAELAQLSTGNALSVTVGVRYTVPATSTSGETITDELFATVTAGGATSSRVSAVATDTVHVATLAVTKTDNGPWTIGQTGAQYTIVPANTGNIATSATISVTDTLPSGLSANGTPSGAGWSCSVTGGNALTCTSTTAIAAGSNGSAITVPVTIGTTTPTGSNAISNVADTFGGGDPVHTSGATAATSTPDRTTIDPAPGLTNIPSGGTVTAGTTATDTFTLTNTSGQSGKFNVPSAPAIAGSGGAITPSGYLVNGGATVYPTLATLQAALAALAPTANAGHVTVGVEYGVPANSLPGQTITDQLAATVTAGAATSAPVSATATDSLLGPTLALTTTDNGPWTVGQPAAQYLVTARNTGNATTTGTITVTDTVPANLAINGTPGGSGWSCSVSGSNAMTCTSTAAIAAQTSGVTIVVPVTIGTGTPIGTNAISNTAKAFGGGDAAHPTAGTAVSSAVDQTTVYGPAQLTNTTANSNVTPGTTATDTFTLTNDSGQPGTFNIPFAPSISSSSGAVSPSGYVLNGGTTVYATLTALQGALSTLTVPNGSTATVGVQYAVASGSVPAQTFVDQLFAEITAGGALSSPVSATATDTVRAPELFIAETDNGPWTIGQSGAQYTILVTNTGNNATSGTITVTDTLSTGLTVKGTPSGGGWSCSVTGTNALTCTTTSAIAAGANGTAITVPVTIGSATPVGSNAISNIASTFGGGDLIHANAGSAATSDPDVTSINATASLTNAAVSSTVSPGTTATDTFTITNTSGRPGTFNAPTAAEIAGPAGLISPSGYVLNGGTTVYSTLAALQAALAALAPTPSGSSITVGVQYVVPTGLAGQSVSDTFAPTLTSGGVTSAIAPSTATDTIAQAPALSVTPNLPAGQSVGTGANVDDAFTVTNLGSASGTFNVTATVVAAGGATVPAHYTLTVNGKTTTYTVVGALNAALAAAPIP
ncbi:MAG TPA: hypothetical protein VME66_03470, partial [Candidatus Acidoferrales bacterium]|nr:hypothetical protein [Candidatus Acidoferrales bacterium]